MTEPAAILEVRHVRVAEHVMLSPTPLADGEEGVFVAHDEPPPVRTVLGVREDGQRRVLEVVRVVEVADRDERGTRGFYARWVDGEALERAAKVGTEHLEDGTPVVQPVVSDDSVAMSISDATGMAMPAPVMMDVDDTGVIDVDDREDAYDAAAPSESDGSGEAEADASEDGSDEADGDASEDGSDEADASETDGSGEAEGDASEDGSDEADGDASEDGSDEAEGSDEGDGSEADASDESGEATQQEAPSGGKRRGGRRKRGKRRR